MKECLKVYFNNALSEHDSGVSPGGALFPKGYYLEYDLGEKSIVLRPECKLKSEGDLIVFQFSDGLAVCLAFYVVDRTEKISRAVPDEPLIRKDLLIFNFRIPSDKRVHVEAFLIHNSDIVLGWCAGDSCTVELVGKEGSFPVEAEAYEALTRSESAKVFMEKFFAADLTPPGRQWIVLRSHPTSGKAAEFGPF